MLQNKNLFILKLILIFSILTLCIAYFIQYFLGHEPCNLCLIERVPYFLAIIIIPMLLVSSKFNKTFFILLILAFIFGTVVSFYHFGIEQGFFKESLVCELNNNSNNLSKEDILKEFEKKIISCKDVNFKILGLSLATINTIISLILSAIVANIFLNNEKNKSK